MTKRKTALRQSLTDPTRIVREHFCLRCDWALSNEEIVMAMRDILNDDGSMICSSCRRKEYQQKQEQTK